VIIATSIYNDVLKSYGGYSRQALLFIGFGWLAATIALAIILKKSSWRNLDIVSERGQEID